MAKPRTTEPPADTQDHTSPEQLAELTGIDSTDPLRYEAPDLSALTDEQRTVFERLTAPFRPDEIELLPKPFKNSKDANCRECGGYHGLPAAHLSYVGHAGMTMRLVEVDPTWRWTPLHPDIDERALAALFQSGMTGDALAVALQWLAEHSPPRIENGGIWIRLHVAGFTAIGFGDADGKTGSPRDVKVMIGDAIRNAAMRLGVGTYLWSKSERAQATLARHGVPDDEPAPRRAERQLSGEDPWPVKPLTDAGQELVWQALAADDDRTLVTLYTRARGLAEQHVTPAFLGEAAPILNIDGPFTLVSFVERVQQFVTHFRISPVVAVEQGQSKNQGGADQAHPSENELESTGGAEQ